MELFNIRKNINISGGLTLIELLVVIVIIGILTTMGFAAVARARDKANNSRIQAELSQVRVQAVSIRNSTDSFTDLCAGNTLNDAGYPDTLGLLESDITTKSSAVVDCYAIDDSYCVRARMAPSGYYCADSTGYAGISRLDCNGTNYICE